MVEYLAATTGVRTVLATHFHELADLADRVPNVANLQSVADVALASDAEHRFAAERVSYPFRVAPGASGRSFGLHVAYRTGFPLEVLERAAQLQRSEGRRTD